MKIRINKYLSNIGYCSRREADKLIESKRVKINDVIANLGSLIDEFDTIKIDNEVVYKNDEKLYFKFNKPRGIVCTTDKSEPNNIIDYINYTKRIYPIGRLDKDSEGLILLTNDGDIVNPILKGSNFKEKEYIVTVDKEIDDITLRRMEMGVPILDTITRPCTIKKINNTTFNIVISQGLNRQIRRMCEYFGYKVTRLKRIRIINIELNNLDLGELKELSKKEILELKKIVGYGDCRG